MSHINGRCYEQTNKKCQDRKVSNATKKSLVRTLAFSIFLYGSELYGRSERWNVFEIYYVAGGECSAFRALLKEPFKYLTNSLSRPD